MLHLVICDDEPSQLALLETCVRQWAGERKTDIKISQCQSAQQFLFLWEEGRSVDIALLDIDMPGMNGLCLAHKLRSKGERLQIIFVTGLTDYVLEGYEVDAADFIVKPVEYAGFSLRMDRLMRRLDRAKERYLLVKQGGQTLRCDMREITYIESLTKKALWQRKKPPSRDFSRI